MTFFNHDGKKIGLLTTGLVIMNYNECVTHVIHEFKEVFGADIATGPDSKFGLLAAEMGLMWADTFELLEEVYNSFDPELSSGVSLGRNGRFIGVNFLLALKSTVTAQLVGTEGTVVFAGSVVSRVTSGEKFVLLYDVTIGAAATDGLFESEDVGSVQCLANELTVIETPLNGWASINNAFDAVQGRLEETDANFRIRRIQYLLSGGSGRVDPIRQAVLAVAGVASCQVYENDLDVVDARGQQARSLEVFVSGGINAAVAQALWDNKPGGTPYVGNTVEVVTDSQLFTHNIYFSREVAIDIYIIVDVTVDANYPADGSAQVQAGILVKGNALQIGDDVIVSPYLVGGLSGIDGITDVTIKIGTTANPTQNNNIIITESERAMFDSTRITVNTV